MKQKENKQDLAFIILAGGMGKRMGSAIPKVLHKIGSKPIITRTVETLSFLNLQLIVTVVNPKNKSDVEKEIASKSFYVTQEKPLGTADALKTALKIIPAEIKTLCVLNGDDSAFYSADTLEDVFKDFKKSKSQITVLTTIKGNPTGLGRIERDGQNLKQIVEEKDASGKQKQINEINTGLYFFDRKYLESVIGNVPPSPVTGEYYLTELIAHAVKDNKKVEAYLLQSANEWHGINTQEELESANTLFNNSIHFMGIAGAGASAVAAIARASGFVVTGCDTQSHSAYERNLEGIKVLKGHSPSHLNSVGTLVISAAILKNDPKNKEVEYAKKEKIPVLLWEEFQSRYLQNGKFLITISGAYGKSTTTAMISQILIDANLDPTCEIGAKVLDWNVNFRIGSSAYYVCEADEYMDKFQIYKPKIAVILNLGWDHPDFFKTKDSVKSSYKKFIDALEEGSTLVIPQDLKDLAKDNKKITVNPIKNHGPYDLTIIGEFRSENANAAIEVASILGINEKQAKKSIEKFKGLGRRLEQKGKVGETIFYDDYAVQPYTSLKTANALKSMYKDKKILLVFEPHTFSRINKFFDDFVASLKDMTVDEIWITDVYAAREQGDAVGLAKKLSSSISSKVKYVGSIDQATNKLNNEVKNYDVVLTMGAGNVYSIYNQVSKYHG